MMRFFLTLILAGPFLATAGCSNVNVQATNDDQLPFEKTFDEDMAGRSPDYQGPRVIELPAPSYPAHLSGQVGPGLIMIRVLVGVDGKVAEAEISQGLQDEVDQAALDAAREGTYAPANESDIATEGWVTVPFRYPPEEAAE